MNRYKGIYVAPSDSGINYRVNTIFPTIEPQEDDLYVITTGGDRYDTLASTYYKNSALWWIIASANNSKKDSLNVSPGVQIRIPMDTSSIIQQYKELNKNR